MLVCNLLHGCSVSVTMVGKKTENGKRFYFFLLLFFFLFVCSKWICSPLLRVTTNHLYSFGKCRFTWRLMILCACSDFFQLCPGDLSLVKMLVRTFSFSISWSHDCENELFDVLSRLLEIHQDGEKLLVFFFQQCSRIWIYIYVCFNFVFLKCT